MGAIESRGLMTGMSRTAIKLSQDVLNSHTLQPLPKSELTPSNLRQLGHFMTVLDSNVSLMTTLSKTLPTVGKGYA